MTSASIHSHSARRSHTRGVPDKADMQRKISSRLQYVQGAVKNLALSTDQRADARKWVADLLWVAFPSDHEKELARKAAPVLDVSQRQVINYLRCANDCPWRVVAIILAVAGAEVVFKKIEGKE